MRGTLTNTDHERYAHKAGTRSHGWPRAQEHELLHEQGLSLGRCTKEPCDEQASAGRRASQRRLKNTRPAQSTRPESGEGVGALGFGALGDWERSPRRARCGSPRASTCQRRGHGVLRWAEGTSRGLASFEASAWVAGHLLEALKCARKHSGAGAHSQPSLVTSRLTTPLTDHPGDPILL